MPFTAWASDDWSPCTSMVVAASAASGVSAAGTDFVTRWRYPPDLPQARFPASPRKIRAFRARRPVSSPGRQCSPRWPVPASAWGLRLLERGAGAFQVIGGDHDLHAPERGVGKVDVDVGVGELPGQLAEGHGPVLDVDHQDLALVGDPHPGAPERRPASGHGIVVQQHMDDTPALTGEGRKATDTDARFASNLPQPGQLTRPVLENNCQVRGHRILDLPTAPGT